MMWPVPESPNILRAPEKEATEPRTEKITMTLTERCKMIVPRLLQRIVCLVKGVLPSGRIDPMV